MEKKNYVRSEADKEHEGITAAHRGASGESAKISRIVAEPVEHGRWIPCESETGEGSNTYKCSACGEIQMIIDGTPKENGWKYCPYCGARMDEGTEQQVI